MYIGYIGPPCFVVIFWFFHVKPNCTVFPLFVSLNVGFVRLASLQYFPSSSGPNTLVLVLTTSVVLISVGGCLVVYYHHISY